MRARQVFGWLSVVILCTGCTILLFSVFSGCRHEKDVRLIALNDSIVAHLRDTTRLYPLLDELEFLPAVSQKTVLLMLTATHSLDSLEHNGYGCTIKRFVDIYKRNIVLTDGLEQLDLQMGLLEFCKNDGRRREWTGGWNLIIDIAGNPLLTGERLARYQLVVSRKLSLEESFKMLEKALTYYSKSEDKHAYIDALRWYSIDCLKAGDYDRALEYCTKSYNIAKGTNFEARCGKMFGVIYREKGDYREALKWWKRYGGEGVLLVKLYNRVDSTEKARNLARKLINRACLSMGDFGYVNEIAISYEKEGKQDSAAFVRTQLLREVDAGRYSLLKYVGSMSCIYRCHAAYLKNKGDLQGALALLSRIERIHVRPIAQEAYGEQLEGLIDLFTLNYELGKTEDGKRVWRLYDSLRAGKEELAMLERYRLLGYKHAEQELISRISEQHHSMVYMRMVLILIITCSVVLLVVAVLLWFLYRMRQRHISELYARLNEMDELKERIEEEITVKEDTQERRLFDGIETLMKEKFLFQNKKLTLMDLALMVDSNRTYVSVCINQFTGLNFNQWVNRYRIEYVLAHIQELEINTLASRAGFTSVATFYRCFKLCVQMTPKEYLEKLGAESR